MMKTLKSLLAPLVGAGLLSAGVSTPALATDPLCYRVSLTFVNKTPYTRTARVWLNSADDNTYTSKGTIADAPNVKQGSRRYKCDANSLVGVQYKKDIRIVVPPNSSKKTQIVSLDTDLQSTRDVISITGLGEDLTPYIASKPAPVPAWYNIQTDVQGDAAYTRVYYSNTGGTYGFLNNGQMNLNLTRVSDGSSAWDAGTGTWATLTPSAEMRSDNYKLWTNGGRFVFTWWHTNPGQRTPTSN